MNRQQAINIRDRVLDDLPGPWIGWANQNINWYVQWRCGAVKLFYSENFEEEPRFWCMVGDLDDYAGRYEFQVSGDHPTFPTPQEAIRYICDDAMRAIDERLRPIISSVESVREMVRE